MPSLTLLPFLTADPDFGLWPDCWVSMEFLHDPIPWKGSGSTITMFDHCHIKTNVGCKLVLEIYDHTITFHLTNYRQYHIFCMKMLNGIEENFMYNHLAAGQNAALEMTLYILQSQADTGHLSEHLKTVASTLLIYLPSCFSQQTQTTKGPLCNLHVNIAPVCYLSNHSKIEAFL